VGRSRLFVDMGSMYLKAYRIQLDYILFVVKYLTVAYAAKQKMAPTGFLHEKATPNS